MMSTRLYFTLTLLLPVVVGLLGLIVDALSLFWVGLVSGCLVYVPLAIFAAMRLRRISSTDQLRLMGFLLPLVFSILFGLLYGVAWLLEGSGPGVILVAFPAVVLALLVSYGYLLVACLGWHALKAIGVVRNELAT
jgi:hypothetical protein